MSAILVPILYSGYGEDASLETPSREALAAARRLGDPIAVVIGVPGTAKTLLVSLLEAGAAEVYAAEAPQARRSLGVSETDVISSLAVADTPGNVGGIILPDSILHREIAGRLAARLGSGLSGDITAIESPCSVTHSIFGSQCDVEASIKGPYPIAVLRNGTEELPDDPLVEGVTPEDAAQHLHKMELPTHRHQRCVRVTAIERETVSDRPALAQASIVVAGGRGVGSAENFTTYVEGLADLLGAAVGATRDAVDLGYCNSALQIGQTGVTVTPDLYIGVGISGAIQHKAGIQGAKHIIAVNNDPDAPIFEIADLGIVGDIEDVLPELLTAVRNAKASHAL